MVGVMTSSRAVFWGCVLPCASIVACRSDDARVGGAPEEPPGATETNGDSARQGQDAGADSGAPDRALGPLPDLVLDGAYLLDTTVMDRVTVDNMCLLQEGCVTGLGERKVVRFGSRTGNLGSADFRLGAPALGNPLWTRNTCRESYDLVGFARYALIDRATGETVVAGAKNGFCIADADQWKSEAFGLCNVYDCDEQGISQGCADNYGSDLECQWVDVTDVPSGAYELQVTINADRNVAELDYANNVVRVQLEIEGDELSVER